MGVSGSDEISLKTRIGTALDGELLALMRQIIAANEVLAKEVFSEWELDFLRSVSARARDYRDHLTGKQSAKSKQILTKPAALLYLAALLAQTAQKSSEIATSAISENALTDVILEVAPESYAADPEWGLF